MRYPNKLSKNVYLAYVKKENVEKVTYQKLNSANLNWDVNLPDTLVEICIKTIAENWSSKKIVYLKIFYINFQFSSLSIFLINNCV